MIESGRISDFQCKNYLCYSSYPFLVSLLIVTIAPKKFYSGEVNSF